MEPQPGKKGGYFALTLTCTLWGTTWVASKIGVMHMPALQMAAIRQFLAGLCFLIFFMGVKKLPWPTKGQWKRLAILGLLMFVFANGLSTWSLYFIPSGLSALIGALYPLCVALIEIVFFRSKRMSLLSATGFILGLAGVGIVFYENAFSGLSDGFIYGILLSLGAMISWTLGTVFIVRGNTSMNPYYATGWQMLISSVILYIMSEILQPGLPIFNIPVEAWLVIIYLVVFGSVISFVAFIFSMKKLPAPIASLYAYINPLVALLTGALILGEKLTIHILYGAIVTMAGVFLVNYSIRKNEKVIAEPEI